jgi:hypothetical protein
MRAAIDRILQQPNLSGINTQNLEETAYLECMQTPAAVRPATDAPLGSKVQWSNVIAGGNTHALIYRTIQRWYRSMSLTLVCHALKSLNTNPWVFLKLT